MMNEPLYRDSDLNLIRRLILSKTLKLEDVGKVLAESESKPLADVLKERGVNVADPAKRFGKYEILEKLGEGGMGVVWKAKQGELGRLVALKFVTGASKNDLDRFRREATLSAQLSHPNIAAIYEFGEENGQPYIAMQFIDGQTLAGLRMPVRRALEVIRDAAEAVHHAHLRGIVHRDLKPHNLMLDRDGRVYVMDFGLARSIRPDTGTTVTVSGEILGTPGYMSPEQIQAQMHKIGPATDVWSLGVALYQLVTGSMPFAAEKIADLIPAIAHLEPIAPRLRMPSLDRDVETIILRCLEKDPALRYPSAGELAADLSRALRGETIVARRLGVLGKIVRSVRRNPGPVAAVVLAGLFALPFTFSWGRSAADAPHDPRIQFDDALRQKDYARAARYYLDLVRLEDDRIRFAQAVLNQYKKEELLSRRELSQSLTYLGAELSAKSRDHAMAVWAMAVALDPDNMGARDSLGYSLPRGSAQDRLTAPSASFGRVDPILDPPGAAFRLESNAIPSRLQPGRHTVIVSLEERDRALYRLDVPAGAWAKPKIRIPKEPAPDGFVFVSDGFNGGSFISTNLVTEKEFSEFLRASGKTPRGNSNDRVLVKRDEAAEFCAWRGGELLPAADFELIDGAWWALPENHVEWGADRAMKFSAKSWRDVKAAPEALPFRILRRPK